MTKRQFYMLSKRYLEGSATAEEERLIREIIENDLHEPTPSTPSAEDVARQKRIWSVINETLHPSRRLVTSVIVSGLAASLLIGAFFLLRPAGRGTDTPLTAPKTLTQVPAAHYFDIRNLTEKEKEVRLEDGTVVVLKKSSSIRYDKSFNQQRREVILTGDAFFKVAHNPQKPFLVLANGLVTKVLGTSFRVRASQADKEVTVAVKSGKVTVYPGRTLYAIDPETRGMVLTPNQQISYDAEEETMIRSLVEKPTLLIPARSLNGFTFRSTPVSAILEALERAYGVDMVYDESVLASCKLTTSLTSETLFEKLDILCEAIGATYKVVDAQVLIESPGCR
jgi:transmembrane sensor